MRIYSLPQKKQNLSHYLKFDIQVQPLKEPRPFSRYFGKLKYLSPQIEPHNQLQEVI
jgi:hypothetical protein